MLRDLWFRVRALLRRRSVETELDEELRFHLERQVEKCEQGGLSRGEAQRRASVEFGGLELAKEECRDARGLRLLENLFQDVRYGMRVLRKSPGFTTVAILTLALGIAANTTIFSVVNAFLLRKPPVRDPDRVMVVSSVNPAKDAYAPDRTPVSALDFLDWQAQSHSFSAMAAADFEDFTLSGGLAPQRVAGARVSSSLWALLLQEGKRSCPKRTSGDTITPLF